MFNFFLDQYEDLQFSLYNTPWYNWSPKDSRAFIILLSMSQNKLVMNSGGLKILTLDWYSNIYKEAYQISLILGDVVSILCCPLFLLSLVNWTFFFFTDQFRSVINTKSIFNTHAALNKPLKNWNKKLLLRTRNAHFLIPLMWQMKKETKKKWRRKTERRQ